MSITSSSLGSPLPHTGIPSAGTCAASSTQTEWAPLCVHSDDILWMPLSDFDSESYIAPNEPGSFKHRMITPLSETSDGETRVPEDLEGLRRYAYAVHTCNRRNPYLSSEGDFLESDNDAPPQAIAVAYSDLTINAAPPSLNDRPSPPTEPDCEETGNLELQHPRMQAQEEIFSPEQLPPLNATLHPMTSQRASLPE